MVPYKKIDLIVEAFSKTDKKLLVIGTGPDFEKIKNKATPNIDILGFVETKEMIELTQRAKAFVFAAEEDFGIAPIEAQACGVPVIAYAKGGALETVIGDTNGIIKQNHTGIFFKEQTIDSIVKAIDAVEKNYEKFDKETIRKNALRFSRERFEREFEELINRKYNEWKDQ